MRILADASLPGLEAAFPAPFILSLYSSPTEFSGLLEEQDILLCRSTLKINADLLKTSQLQFLATASSGTDHLDHSSISSQNIQIIDAKGANATAVADYVVSCLAYLERTNKIKGKKAGIIGLGNVGEKVSMRLRADQFDLSCYDPLKALHNKQFESCTKEKLYEVDLLCIHAELHNQPPYQSVNLIDDVFLNSLKPGCVIINAARGGIINEDALLNSRNGLVYCTDVYLNEPNIDKRIVEKATLCTPHIAGHSVEAKCAAVRMISQKLHRILGFKEPSFPQVSIPLEIIDPPEQTWQKLALSLYNPVDETVLLKQSHNLESAFISLRKSHSKRHDFSIYSDWILDENKRVMLGI